MKKIFIRPTLCCNPKPLDTTPIDDMEAIRDKALANEIVTIDCRLGNYREFKLKPKIDLSGFCMDRSVQHQRCKDFKKKKKAKRRQNKNRR